RATVRLGMTTDTLDAEGSELVRSEVNPDLLVQLPEVLDQFRGDIDQIPPMYSALKRNGVPLYKLARAGQVVEREARHVRINRLELIASDLPDLTLEIDCTKGTYIRSLCADIGERLGCGAHIVALRRLRTGAYPIERCLPLEQLDDAADILQSPAFMSVDDALVEYPVALLSADAASLLRNGVPPNLESLVHEPTCVSGALVRLVFDGHLLAMARYAPERLKERRGDFELIRGFNCQNPAD
ncbi:MAG: tRNA pseudouridine(55) synthase TruB, partial [Geopsychrobacter sp.]|nr:tRNA pseudouridine(55) synthase TruB [Geopsychrobacter sp.]